MSLNIIPKLLPQTDEQRRAKRHREMLNHEAEIGGKLFGPVPKGHNRRFFCLDEHTWIWHEEWKENSQTRTITTRYDVRPTGVIKVQDGQAAQRLSFDEARNLYQAVELYYQQVIADYRHQSA